MNQTFGSKSLTWNLHGADKEDLAEVLPTGHHPYHQPVRQGVPSHRTPTLLPRPRWLWPNNTVHDGQKILLPRSLVEQSTDA